MTPAPDPCDAKSSSHKLQFVDSDSAGEVMQSDPLGGFFILTKGQYMTAGRNDPCPCGSGRKYKKCCLNEESRSQKSGGFSTQPQPGHAAEPITLETLAQISRLEELPWVRGKSLAGAMDTRTHGRLLQDMIVVLNDSLAQTKCDFLSSDELIVEARFKSPSKRNFFQDRGEYEKHFYNHSRNPFDDEFDDESEFFGDNDDILEVGIQEETPRGRLRTGSLLNGDSAKPESCAVQVNATLYLIWLATSKHAKIDKASGDLSAIVWDLREKIERAKNHQPERQRARAKILKDLEAIRLDSLILVVSPLLADQTILNLKEVSNAMPFRFSQDIHFSQKSEAGPSNISFLYLEENPAYEISPVFLEKNESFSGQMNWNNICKQGDLIWYRFSNGLVLSSREILKRPEALLIPPDLLPGIAKFQNSLWRNFFTDLGPEYKKAKGQQDRASDSLIECLSEGEKGRAFLGFEFLKVDTAFDSILQAAKERLNRRELEILTIFGSDVPRTRIKAGEPYSKISKIEPLGSDFLDSTVGCSSYRLDENNPNSLNSVQAEIRLTPKNMISKNSLAMRFGFFDLQSGILCRRNLAADVQRLKYFQFNHHGLEDARMYSVNAPVPQPREKEYVQVESRVRPTLDVTIRARGRKAVLSTLGSLEEAGYLSPQSHDLHPLHLTATPEIHLEPNGHFLFARCLQNQAEGSPLSQRHLIGFSDATLQVQEALRGGFVGYFNREAKELAVRTKKFRELEMKLYRHTGIANLLVYEALHARFRFRMSDGQPAKDAKELLTRLEGKILILLGCLNDSSTTGGAQPPLKMSLRDVCSKSLFERLIGFIKDFMETGHEKLFRTPLPEGFTSIPKFIEPELLLLLTCLDYAAAASKGEIFAKSRINVFEKILPPTRVGMNKLSILLSDKEQITQAAGHEAYCWRVPYANDVATAAGSRIERMGGELRQTLGALQPLMDSGFFIYFSGRQIKALGAEDFRTELELRTKDSAIARDSGSPVKNGSVIADDLDRSGDTSVQTLKKDRHIALQSAKLDWFELHPKFFLHGQEIFGVEVQQALRDGIVTHGDQLYLIPASRLPTLRKLAGFWDRLQSAKNSKGRSERESPVFQVPRSQILEMLALRRSGIPVIGTESWKEICQFYDDLDRHERTFQIPDSLHGTLKEYQKIGVQRLYELYRLGLGAILADDMGLGKTIQALTFLEKLRSENRLGPSLIVVPTSLTYNWLSESQRFVPDLSMTAFSGKTKAKILEKLLQAPSSSKFSVSSKAPSAPSGQVILATYGLVQEHKEFFAALKWDVVIFDEAQNLKNISAQRTSIARSLNARAKICMTGTPLENHLGELYSLVDLSVPGCLGDLEEFRRIYVNPMSVHRDDIDYLKLKTKPLILRRTKHEILLELPEKQESRVVLPFEKKQKTIYRDVAIAYNKKIQDAIAENGEAKCQLQMLTALLRLRQACSDPAALPGIKYTAVPPKLEALCEALVEIVDTGESALVFTQFLQTLERAASVLREAHIPAFVIHGGLSRTARESVLKQFNEFEGGAVLLMTLKTGGVGLNLTKASYVFHLEPWWNPAVENQASDRAHRLGQKNAVQVYRYIMHESVEEKIEKLKMQKQNRFNAMFAGGEQIEFTESEPRDCEVSLQGQNLNRGDFEFLLS